MHTLSEVRLAERVARGPLSPARRCPLPGQDWSNRPGPPRLSCFLSPLSLFFSLSFFLSRALSLSLSFSVEMASAAGRCLLHHEDAPGHSWLQVDRTQSTELGGSLSDYLSLSLTLCSLLYLSHRLTPPTHVLVHASSLIVPALSDVQMPAPPKPLNPKTETPHPRP